MGKADRLSRRPDWKVGVENDNKNQVVIKDSWIHSIQKVVIEGLEVNIVEKIKKARSKDEKVVKVVEQMKKAKVKMLKNDKQQIEEGLVLKEGKVYMPKDKSLKVEIIQLHHDTLVAEYKERQKMVELVTKNYWWPGVTRDVGRYVEGCNMCQRMKNRIEVLAGKLKLSKVAKRL